MARRAKEENSPVDQLSADVEALPEGTASETINGTASETINGTADRMAAARAAAAGMPRVRKEAEYYIVATDLNGEQAEFVWREKTVGQIRKARAKMLGSPLVRGRRLRIARLVYVDE